MNLLQPSDKNLLQEESTRTHIMFKTRGWPHTGYVCPLNDIRKDDTSFNTLNWKHMVVKPKWILGMLLLKAATFFF